MRSLTGKSQCSAFRRGGRASADCLTFSVNLLRMVRMLNGAFSLDEIRFRANLSRRDIKIVLAAFADNLIVFTHPQT